MSTDFEQRLRAEMEQVAVRPRPGLVKEAYRSYRGKRRMTRTVAATGTAIAIAAGTVAGFAAATASPAAIPAQTTAYIVSHVSSALAATDEISYTIETVNFGPPANTRLVFDSWHYGTRDRQLEETASGQPLWDGWGQIGHGNTMVDYRQRSWVLSGPGQGSGSGSVSQLSPCQAHGPLTLVQGATAADMKPVIESGLRCGLYHVVGHQRVDGIDAIKLTGNSGRGIVIGDGGITLWVDPHTYLPVQIAAGTQAHPAPQAATWIQFRWLPPTRANLAQLTGTIPPGFHRT
jgi:hypothetical protein